MLDEQEGIQKVSKLMSPYVELEGSKIYKSTLANQLNGNPMLSKDQLMRIRSGIIYMEEERKKEKLRLYIVPA